MVYLRKYNILHPGVCYGVRYYFEVVEYGVGTCFTEIISTPQLCEPQKLIVSGSRTSVRRRGR